VTVVTLFREVSVANTRSFHLIWKPSDTPLSWSFSCRPFACVRGDSPGRSLEQLEDARQPLP